MILQRVGARRWICVLMVLWGCISASTALVPTPNGFYSLRFLLGSAEAGFFPGIILYVKNWFPGVVRARTIALFMAAGPLSGVIGGPISGFLLGVHGHGNFAGWQWLFLDRSGLPAISLGLLVFFWLADNPQDARWLAAAERECLLTALEAEQHPGSSENRPRTMKVFASVPVWLLALGLFGITSCTSGISLWLPTLIHSVSASSNLTIGVLSAVPYIAAAIAEVLVGLHSDRTGERRWHVVILALTGAAAIVGAAYFTSLVAILVATQVWLLYALIPRLGHFGRWRPGCSKVVLPWELR